MTNAPIYRAYAIHRDAVVSPEFQGTVVLDRETGQPLVTTHTSRESAEGACEGYDRWLCDTVVEVGGAWFSVAPQYEADPIWTAIETPAWSTAEYPAPVDPFAEVDGE